MELSRQEYPGMLASLQPAQAVTVLAERVKRMNRVNAEIADWLQERRKVEESYVQGLKKLARRQPPDESSELGIFAGPWQRLVSSTDALASSHHVLAQKIEVDVERPLRDFTTRNQEMQAMSNIQTNLNSLAKEVESAQDRSDKLKRRGAKAAAEKVASATTEVETAMAQWHSQAPFVFESLQAADEARLSRLRDVLTQFQTHEVDQVERNRVTAENCLNALLNLETADEIRAFVAQTVSGKPKLERPRSPATSAANAVSPPRSSQATDERPSQRSKTPVGSSRAAAAPEPKHERFSLKRFGTVIGKRRQSMLPPGRAASPEKRSSDFFGSSSRAGRSNRDAPPLPTTASSSKLETPSSPTQDGRSGLRRLGSSPSAQRSRSRRSREQSNGDAIETSAVPTTAGRRDMNGTDSSPAPRLDQDVSGTPFNLTMTSSPAEDRRDTEGYTIPPSTTDAISQAEQEAAAETPQSQFKLDIRNKPIHEEDDDAETAMAAVTNTLRAQAAPTRKTGTIRGRRDVRNTIFVPSGQAPDIFAGEPPAPSSPPKATRAATLMTEESATSDSQSVRSARSLSSLALAVVKHPELRQPGLNSSIVETVNASFEQGQVAKTVVIGELALAYNPTGSSPSTGSRGIRLENFAVLERVASNPTFITPVTDRSGEYHVELKGAERPTVAFKYQVHLDESSLNQHCPLILTPAWKIEPKQTSVILQYSLNPAFGAGQTSAITLTNVNVVVKFHGHASNCQIKPSGTFSKEKSLLWWQLKNVTLQADGPPNRLLARFSTESEAKAGPIEARWEMSGEENVAALGSGLGVSQAGPASPGTDPFADESTAAGSEGGWKAVPTVRRLVSGKYVATS